MVFSLDWFAFSTVHWLFSIDFVTFTAWCNLHHLRHLQTCFELRDVYQTISSIAQNNQNWWWNYTRKIIPDFTSYILHLVKFKNFSCFFVQVHLGWWCLSCQQPFLENTSWRKCCFLLLIKSLTVSFFFIIFSLQSNRFQDGRQSTIFSIRNSDKSCSLFKCTSFLIVFYFRNNQPFGAICNIFSS
jgi:hypothetical protein